MNGDGRTLGAQTIYFMGVDGFIMGDAEKTMNYGEYGKFMCLYWPESGTDLHLCITEIGSGETKYLTSYRPAVKHDSETDRITLDVNISQWWQLWFCLYNS